MSKKATLVLLKPVCVGLLSGEATPRTSKYIDQLDSQSNSSVSGAFI